MKSIRFSLVSLALVLTATLGFAQTLLTNTTLSTAVADSATRTVTVASATGINAPSASDFTKATYIYVDREAMDVQAVNSTTVTVRRGAIGTTAAPHASSAVVFVIPAYLSTLFGQLPQGSCTRANEVALPRIQAQSGVISDCLGGQWYNGTSSTQTTFLARSGMRVPDPGATALTALETAGTAPSAATEQYCSEVFIPESTLITGLGVLNGTTVGTDKHLVILYDSGGKVLANSAVAGATTAVASTYQKMNFLSKYFAVGPARYFACMQTNGTTDTIRHPITAVNDNIIGGAITTQVFGTVAAVTLPTTFTTAKAPYFLVY